MNQVRHTNVGQALREKQQIPFKIVDSFIRIPISGILIKFLSLRSLRLVRRFCGGLCGEIVFGQECPSIKDLG